MNPCIDTTELTEQEELDLQHDWDEIYEAHMEATGDAFQAQANTLRDMMNIYEGRQARHRADARQVMKMYHLDKEIDDAFQKGLDEYNALDNRFKQAVRRTPKRDYYVEEVLQRAFIRGNTNYTRALDILSDSLKVNGLDPMDPNVMKLLTNHDVMADAFRYLHTGGAKTSDGTSVGKAMRSVLENQYMDRIKSGQFFPKRKNWGFQQWEGTKFRKVKKDEFAQDALERFSWREMDDPMRKGHKFQKAELPTLKERTRMLRFIDEMYEDLVTDGARAIQRLKEQGIDPGAAQGNKYAAPKPRIVEIEDFDDWLFMNDKYGHGNEDLLGMAFNHFNGEAMDIAAIQVLGPDPYRTFSWIGSGTRPTTGMMFRTLTRGYESQGNSLLHNATMSTHNLLRASLLGKAALASLNDPIVTGATAGMIGLTRRNGLAQTMEGYRVMLTTLQKSDERMAKIAGANGRAISEAVADNIAATARFGGEALNGMEGKITRATSKYSNAVMKYTMMKHITQSTGDTMSMAVSGDLGMYVSRQTPWDEIEPSFRQFMERSDVNADDWAKVLKTETVSHQGDDAFLNVSSIQDRSVMLKMMDVNESARMMALNAPDLKMKAWGTLGSAPGTVPRAISSSIVLFRSWPVMLMRNITIPMIRNAIDSPATAMSTLGMFAVQMTLMGAVVVQLKNFASGRTMERMDDPAFWEKSFVQGGSFGLIADILLRDTGYGNSVARDIGGPVVSLADDLLKLASPAAKTFVPWKDDELTGNELRAQMTRLIKRYAMPNIWYLDAFLDTAMYETIEAIPALDPTYFDREETRLQKIYSERGQEVWNRL